MCLGSLAGSLVVLLMVAACILMIQIGYSAGARAMMAASVKVPPVSIPSP